MARTLLMISILAILLPYINGSGKHGCHKKLNCNQVGNQSDTFISHGGGAKCCDWGFCCAKEDDECDHRVCPNEDICCEPGYCCYPAHEEEPGFDWNWLQTLRFIIPALGFGIGCICFVIYRKKQKKRWAGVNATVNATTYVVPQAADSKLPPPPYTTLDSNTRNFPAPPPTPAATTNYGTYQTYGPPPQA